MLKNWKFTGTILSALWLVFAWHIVAIELVHLNYVLWLTIGCIVAVMIVAFHVYFLWYYFKNKGKIARLQQEYIETLKPDKPLRFCPTDEELMKAHLHQLSGEDKKTQTQTSETKEKPEKENDDEELELS